MMHIRAHGTGQMWCGISSEDDPSGASIMLLTTATGTRVQEYFDRTVRERVDCPVCQMHYWNGRPK